MRKLRIRWRKSTIGYSHDQKDTIRERGLRRPKEVGEHEDAPAIRCMVAKVAHRVEVEEVTS